MTCKMILNSADTDFSDRFVALQSMKREQDADVHADVSAIIDAVRTDGDDALVAYTKKFIPYLIPIEAIHELIENVGKF